MLNLILLGCLMAIISCSDDEHDHHADTYGPGHPQFPQYHRVIRQPHIPVDESNVVHPGRLHHQSAHNADEHIHPNARSAEQAYREFFEQQSNFECEQDYRDHQHHEQDDHHAHEHGPHCQHAHAHEHADRRAQFADVLPPSPHPDPKRSDGSGRSSHVIRQQQRQHGDHQHGRASSHLHSPDALQSYASWAESLGLGGVIQFVKDFLSKYASVAADLPDRTDRRPILISRYDENDSFLLTMQFTAAIGLLPIAILPFFSLFLYNLQTQSVNTILLDALLAFAAGGLLGKLIGEIL